MLQKLRWKRFAKSIRDRIKLNYRKSAEQQLKFKMRVLCVLVRDPDSTEYLLAEVVNRHYHRKVVRFRTVYKPTENN